MADPFDESSVSSTSTYISITPPHFSIRSIQELGRGVEIGIGIGLSCLRSIRNYVYVSSNQCFLTFLTELQRKLAEQT